MTRVVLALAVGLAACGGETVLLVEVDVSNHVVPAEIDLIHLELRADDDVIGHNFPLEPGDLHPLYELLPGPRTPASFSLVGYAYLGGALVSQSDRHEVDVADGEEENVRLVIP